MPVRDALTLETLQLMVTISCTKYWNKAIRQASPCSNVANATQMHSRTSKLCHVPTEPAGEAGTHCTAPPKSCARLDGRRAGPALAHGLKEAPK